MTGARQARKSRLLTVVLTTASVVAGSIQMLSPVHAVAATSADRASWNATSTQRYQLWNNNGANWIEMDPSRLVLSVTPAVPSTAVLSANSDLFTTANGYNTDLAIEVNGQVVAWKEAGGSTALRPAAVFVQATFSMTVGQTYSVALYWKTNVQQATGIFSQAGAGPGPTVFSPTTLSADLTGTASYVSAAASAPTFQGSTPSQAWTEIDPSLQTQPLTAAAGTYDALITANVDTWSSTARVNQDLGICYAVSTDFSSKCGATASANNVIAYQENGADATYMPIASLVQTRAGGLTLSANTTYQFGIVWKANGSGTIWAGAGGAGNFSPSSIIVQLTPWGDNEQISESAAQLPQESRSYSGSDPGTSWEPVPSVSPITISPSASQLAYLAGNATLFANSGGFNIDLAVCVTTNGTQSCDASGATLAGWMESGVTTSWTPDASFVQVPYYMLAGSTYTVSLEWRTNGVMTNGQTIYAGVNTAPNTTSLTALQVPSSAPSQPINVSVSPAPGQATVSWSAPAMSPGSPVSGYAIRPYLGSTALETEVVPANLSTFTVPNLANGQTYTFTIAAVNGYGPGPTVTTGAVTPGLPGSPTGVSAGSPGNGSVVVSWTAPSSVGASALTGYAITTSPATTTTYSWGRATSATVSGLTNGTSYTFSVAAINVFGSSAAVTSGPAGPQATLPGAPTSVTATAGNASATVSWSAPASNGGAGISSYTITPYIAGTAQTPTSATASPATVSGLTNGTPYTFTVAAINSVGSGAASPQSSTVIPAPIPVVPSVVLSVGQTYGIGMQVPYQATITTNAGSTTTVSFTDTLPAGLSGTGAVVKVNGAACLSPVTCTSTAGAITVSSLSVPTAGMTVTYSLTAIGSQRSCAIEADNATATIANGNSTTSSAPVTVCDSDLGTNAWNSYITQTLGDGGLATVNPANGDLTVTQTDAIPMATASAGSFHLTRTYNSQDTNLAGLSEPFGAGWMPSFVDLGTEPGGVGLIAPPSSSATVANGPPVTLVDTSGARYVFQPTAITPINTSGLSASAVLGALAPRALTGGTGYVTTCVDESLPAPTGIHESMWRYTETTAFSGCGTANNSAVLGYATLGVDRVRHEYNAAGQLIDIQDAAGNDFRYTYAGSALAAVTEHATGRAFTITTNGNTVTTKDPGGETTTYTLSSGALSSVANPDGTTLSYTYGGCTGSAAAQLCSATDGRGHATTFTYSAAAPGPPQVASFTDRNANLTTITYNAANVTSDRFSSLSYNPVSERTSYAAIDASGRVGEIDAGTTANSWVHQTFYGWDTSSAGCRQPDVAVDNDLCSIIRRGLSPGAADRVTYYEYGDEGQMLSQRNLNYPDDLWTTAGYQEQYFERSATVSAYTDTVAGSGTVTSTSQTGGRRDGNTIFDVVAQTQSLTPRGNAAGSSYSTYLTTYTNDTKAISPGWTNGSSVCLTPSTPTSNTGLLCETAAPTYDGTHATDTFTTFSGVGQRATVMSPNGNTYKFIYYAGTDKDLSGTTTAQGWLKAISDPLNYFEVFAYDAEGHTARTWDRDATNADGVALSSADWNTAGDGSLVPHYTETVYGAPENFMSPGRYPAATETPQGEVTTNSYDANGNLLGSLTPVGTNGSFGSAPDCSTLTYETCRNYDNNDNLIQAARPVEGWAHSTTYRYDSFNNRYETINANGKNSWTYYDAGNRPVETAASRINAQANQVPVTSQGCTVSTGADPMFYQYANVCYTYTAYDGVDNTVAASTNYPDVTPTLRLYDAVHRPIETVTPRNDGTFANLETVTLFDEDGHATDVCPPNEFSQGSSDGYACTNTATYGVHTTYNALGKAASTYEYTVIGSAGSTSKLTTAAYSYDGDGNRTAATNGNGFTTTYTFDGGDNKMAMTVPRDSSHSYTTTYHEDPSGSEISEYAPIDGSTNTRNFEWTYDFDHRIVYTITGASAAPPDTNLYNPAGGSDVRTEKVYDADGNIVRQYSPNAFTGSGTLASPNALYSVAATYNADDEQTAVYRPRYDTASLSDPVGNGTQASECPTGQAGFASTTGVCSTKYQYDPVGNVTQVAWPTDSSGNTFTTNLYTDDNLLYATQSPSPANAAQETTQTYTLDTVGRPVNVKDANGLTTTKAYTADELVASVTAPPNGSVTHITSYGYDANGEATSTTDAVGNVSTKAYLPNGWTLSSTDGANDVTSYQYDGDGNPTAIFSPSASAKDSTNPSGRATENFYTEDNLLAATELPVSGTGGTRAVCYFLDQSGRKTGQGNLAMGVGTSVNPCPTSPGTNSFAYFYGVDDRLATEKGRFGTSQLTFSYDAAGNQVSSGDDTTGGVSTSQTFYADNLIRTANDGAGRTTNYAYDGAGNVTGRNSVPSSGTTYTDTIQYSKADLQSAESSSEASGTTSWVYDAGGRLASERYGNGETEALSYAGDGTLAQQTLTPSGSGTATSMFTQTFDGDYRVTNDGCVCLNSSGINVGHTFQYAYDAAGRLIYSAASGGIGAFQTYDHDGNRLVHTDLATGAITSFSYNADDSLYSTTKASSPTYSTYDSYGGGTLTGDGCTTWTLDAFDRTTTYAAASGAPSSCTSPPPPTTTYTHNAAGATVTEAASGFTTTVHDDATTGTPIVERTTNNSVTTETAYGRDSHGTPQALTATSTGVEWLTENPKGDVSTSTTAGGAVQCQMQYDPYGSTLFGQSASNACETGSTSDDLLYQGQRRDSSSGEYQLGARTYDPSKNSFIQPDHFQTGTPSQDLALGTDPLTRNVYTFVDGDPVNRFDPTGHGTCADLNDCNPGPVTTPAGAAAMQAQITTQDNHQAQQNDVSYLTQNDTANLAAQHVLAEYNAMFSTLAAEHTAWMQMEQDIQVHDELETSISWDTYNQEQAATATAAANQCSGFCFGQWYGFAQSHFTGPLQAVSTVSSVISGVTGAVATVCDGVAVVSDGALLPADACGAAMGAVAIASNAVATAADVSLLALGRGNAGDLILDGLTWASFGLGRGIIKYVVPGARAAFTLIQDAHGLPFIIPAIEKCIQFTGNPLCIP